MEQIIIKDGKIIEHIDAPSLHDGAVEVLFFEGTIGSDIREYDDQWKLRPLSDRVKDELVVIPSGFKLDGERIVDMTEDEKIITGILPLPEGMVIDGGLIRIKTIEDMESSGEISHAKYVELKNDQIKDLRKADYSAESDHLFFEEQRGDVEEGTWIRKVAEIKERFPKEV